MGSDQLKRSQILVFEPHSSFLVNIRALIMEGTADRKRTAEESRSVNKDDTAAVGRKRTAEESESVNEDDKHDRSNSNKRRHVQESAVIPREPSIFRVRPVDDIIKYVADFIAKHCSTENVEVSP